MAWQSDVEGNPRALAMLRVSSARRQDNLSHDSQASDIAKYVKDNNLELVEVRRIVESAKRLGERRKYRDAIESALANGTRIW